MLTPANIRELRDAVTYSRKHIEPWRDNRKKAIEKYAGAHYGKPRIEPRPLNMIELLVNTLSRQLAPGNPKTLVTTHDEDQYVRSQEFQVALNETIKDLRLVNTLRRCVVDAVFSPFATCKCGLNASAVEIGGYYNDVGQPFADFVSFDDMVYDTTAKLFTQVQFIGNDYKILARQAQNSGIYDPDVLAKIKPSRQNEHRIDGKRDEGAAELSEQEGWPQTYYGTYWFTDIWLPYEGVVLTIDATGQTDEPLMQVEWDGPEMGPYHHLSFTEIPDNLLGLPPVATATDLDDFENVIWRKLSRQAEDQKEVYGFIGESAADMEKFLDARDQEAISVSNPDGIISKRFGGADANGIAMLLQGRDLFSYFQGNLDALAGLGTQAGTLGQEELIKASSSLRVGDMQEQNYLFQEEVIQSIGFYLWHDPVTERTLTKSIDGFPDEIPFKFGPESRKGEFSQFNVSLDVYSMTPRTPQQRLQQLQGYIQNIFMPLAPFAAEQGLFPDMQEINDTFSSYLDLPEVKRWVRSGQPRTPQGQSAENARTKPATTTRNNVRTSVAGSTREGREKDTINSLLRAGRDNRSEN